METKISSFCSKMPNNSTSSDEEKKQEKVQNRLKIFLKYFQEHFMNKYDAYCEETHKEISAKTPELADIASHAVEICLNPKKLPENIRNLARKNKLRKVKITVKNLRTISEGKNLDDLILQTGFDIFLHLENQFMNLADDHIGEVAKDAVERILNHLSTYPSVEETIGKYSNFLCKCFLEGKSKRLIGNIFFKRTVLFKNVQIKVSKIYDNVGLVIRLNGENKIDKYFKKINGTSEYYEHRLFFTLKDKNYNTDDVIAKATKLFVEEDCPIAPYEYLLLPKQIDQLKKEYLLANKRETEYSSDFSDLSGEMVSPLFTGREKFLEEVSACSKEHGIVVISGLSGVGKSEVALKFARSYHSEDLVFWVNANDRCSAENWFKKMHKKLKLNGKDLDQEDKTTELKVEEVFTELKGSKTLFIFDNAKTYADIKVFLPLQRENTIVLITSASSYSSWEHIHILKLDNFEVNESELFLCHSLEIKNDDVEIKMVISKTVKEVFHNFPMALTLAAKSLKREFDRQRVLEPDFKMEEFVLSPNFYKICSKFDFLKINEICKETLDVFLNDEDISSSARQILNIMAYMSSNGIPPKMFLEIEGDVSKLGEIFLLLEEYFIITHKKKVDMHRFFQNYIRSNLNDEKGTLERALNLLQNDRSDNNIPHIISVWNYACKFDELIEKFMVKNDDLRLFHQIVEHSSYDIIKHTIDSIESNFDKDLLRLINSKYKHKVTPLHIAAVRNDARILELFLQKGANLNAKKMHNWTPLHLSIRTGNSEIAKLLIDEDTIKMNVKTGYKFTCLHLAARNGCLDIVNLLLVKDKNINVNALTKQHFTPLHLAVQKNHQEVVSILLNHHLILIDAQTNFMETALHFAAVNCSTQLFSELIDKGASIDAQNVDGLTALHKSVLYNRSELVGILIEKNAKLNLTTTKGNTALHLAAEQGFLDIISILLSGKNKIDLHILNCEKKTATEVALDFKHVDAADYIKKYMETLDNSSGSPSTRSSSNTVSN